MSIALQPERWIPALRCAAARNDGFVLRIGQIALSLTDCRPVLVHFGGLTTWVAKLSLQYIASSVLSAWLHS